MTQKSISDIVNHSKIKLKVIPYLIFIDLPFSNIMWFLRHIQPPLWSSGQSFWLQIQRSRVRSPALPDFLSSSGSGTGSTQPREVN